MRTLVAALAVLVLAACGGQALAATSAPLPVSTTAAFPQTTTSAGGITDLSMTVYVKWDLFLDPVSNRFVLLGGAGCPTAANCAGVPGGGAWFDLVLPQLPFSNFCVDTLKLGTKQPISARASFLVLSATPGHGQPAVSVRSDDGEVHIDKLCYPHEGQLGPDIWIGNNYCEVYADCNPAAKPIPQVMTFVIAGEVR